MADSDTKHLIDLHDMVAFVESHKDFPESGKTDFDSFREELDDWFEKNEMWISYLDGKSICYGRDSE